MGIFTRFRDIVGSNLSSMLDRAEDPEKLIKLMIQEMEDTLIELKTACAGVIAQSKIIQSELQGVEKRRNYWDEKAKLAVRKGRDDLAKVALIEKRRFVQITESLTHELSENDTLLDQYKDEIRQLEEKLLSAREKERMLVQRHIHAARKRRAQEEMRRMDGLDAVIRFEELEHRIEHMEAEADLVNFGRKATLEDELERLALDDEIEKELQELKLPSMDKIEDRVNALETLLADQNREEKNNAQL